jgi:MOSC domain-containing protein YiiM
VIAVARDVQHRFSKHTVPTITLVAGLGVAGDAHAGARVKHRSRRKKTPEAQNLRQVHLIHAELFEELAEAGFAVSPGQLGENVTTAGIDLLGLARGTRLRLGPDAVIEITGLRNPCFQIEKNIGEGAMAATLARAPDGSLLRKAGVMAIVVAGGDVHAGDVVLVDFVPQVQVGLEPV